MTPRADEQADFRDELAAWAQGEPAVRAVLLVGSRVTDPGRVDELSDYDVVLFLSEPGTLAGDPEWVERFGKVLVELPERFDAAGREVEARLVQYRDGRKVDFNLSSVDALEEIVRAGRLPEGLDAGYEVLVDKDGAASRLPSPSGRAHVPDRPTSSAFQALAEEFWWETLYVAKNLVRGEILPARYSAESVIRYELLVPALEWFVQVGREWSQPVGAYGKGLEGLLPEGVWSRLEATMPGGDATENWDALFATTELFRSVMRPVADDLGIRYPIELDRDVSERLERLRRAWRDAR